MRLLSIEKKKKKKKNTLFKGLEDSREIENELIVDSSFEVIVPPLHTNHPL